MFYMLLLFFFSEGSSTMETSTKTNETAVENEQHSSLVPADVPSLLCVVSFIVLCCLLPHVFSVANYNIDN